MKYGGKYAASETSPTSAIVVNRRVRALVKGGYIEKDGQGKTKTSFTINLYQLSIKAYLVILLNTVNLEEFMETASEQQIITASAIFASKQ